ncbi:MAG: hypothetical protein ACPID1_06125 [Poseidonia sp.]
MLERVGFGAHENIIPKHPSRPKGFIGKRTATGKLFFNAHDELHGSELWNMWFEHTVSYEA